MKNAFVFSAAMPPTPTFSRLNESHPLCACAAQPIFVPFFHPPSPLYTHPTYFFLFPFLRDSYNIQKWITKSEGRFENTVRSATFEFILNKNILRPSFDFHPIFSLIDYEEEVTVPSTTNGASTTAAAAADGEAKDSKKGSYVGIHSTGFRDFLLKPELLRAIADLGFEHPSEGEFWPQDVSLLYFLPLKHIKTFSFHHSATRMHSPINAWNGCHLPG